jgi:hypothetical protein
MSSRQSTALLEAPTLWSACTGCYLQPPEVCTAAKQPVLLVATVEVSNTARHHVLHFLQECLLCVCLPAGAALAGAPPALCGRHCASCTS